jgi:dTDP-4-amino-4,6-dideoxygalactose transaminase
MDALCNIAKAYDLKIVEDCAHAIETEYHGHKAGTMGDFGCFSFYSTKNIVTGEGGMVLARHEEDIARIKVLGLHGMSKDAWKRFGDEGFKHYQVIECGFKYNMMDLQAAIGIHQLKRIEAYWQRRSQIWQYYTDAFSDLPVGIPAPAEANTRHAYHLFNILIDKEKVGVSRDEFLDRMTTQGIGVGVHYLSLPEHPYYRQTFGWKPEDFPNAMRVGRQTVSLPISAKLGDEDLDDVVESVKRAINA